MLATGSTQSHLLQPFSSSDLPSLSLLPSSGAHALHDAPMLRESVSHTQVSAPALPPQGAASPHTPGSLCASLLWPRLSLIPVPSELSHQQCLHSFISALQSPSTDVSRVSNCQAPRLESRNIMGALPHGTWPSRDTDAHQRCPCRHVAQLCRVRQTALGGLREPLWGGGLPSQRAGHHRPTR